MKTPTDSKMSDNLIELPKLVEEKIISYRKYYILENVSPIIQKSKSPWIPEPDSVKARFSAIYDERHIPKMINYLTSIFQKAFEKKEIDSISVEYLAYGDQYNGYTDITEHYYNDTGKIIEETEIMRLFTDFENLRIIGHKDTDGAYCSRIKLDYIIREIYMNCNPIDISPSDEQIENAKKWQEDLERRMRRLESEETS